MIFVLPNAWHGGTDQVWGVKYLAKVSFLPLSAPVTANLRLENMLVALTTPRLRTSRWGYRNSARRPARSHGRPGNLPHNLLGFPRRSWERERRSCALGRKAGVLFNLAHVTSSFHLTMIDVGRNFGGPE
jgi:hypothetical protein